jgi:hypothetical protein
VNLLHYSVQPHSLAEDVKLSAHGRHPTTYPCYFFVVYFVLFFFVLLLLSVFCFSGTSVLEFKFGGNALSQTYSGQFHPSPG